jgi:hypothetical protein
MDILDLENAVAHPIECTVDAGEMALNFYVLFLDFLSIGVRQ